MRKQLLDALAHAATEQTTADLRQELSCWEPGLVNETIYRNLVVLEHRGEVRRLRHPGRRHVTWALTTPGPKQ